MRQDLAGIGKENVGAQWDGKLPEWGSDVIYVLNRILCLLFGEQTTEGKVGSQGLVRRLLPGPGWR